MPVWARDLGFHYERNGAYVLAFSEEEAAALEDLLERGRVNGVEGCRVVSGEEARAVEPNLSPAVVAALDVPASAICDPYGLAFTAAENAAENGVLFVFNKRVTGVVRVEERAGCRYRVEAEGGRSYAARAVVNAAGVFSDEINNMVSERKLTITPKRGNYCLYDSELGDTFSRTMFQVPTARGKGVLVSPTVHGNLFVGPDSEPQESKTDVSTSAEGLDRILAARAHMARGVFARRHQQLRGLARIRRHGGFRDRGSCRRPGFFQHRMLRVARADLRSRRRRANRAGRRRLPGGFRQRLVRPASDLDASLLPDERRGAQARHRARPALRADRVPLLPGDRRRDRRCASRAASRFRRRRRQMAHGRDDGPLPWRFLPARDPAHLLA